MLVQENFLLFIKQNTDADPEEFFPHIRPYTDIGPGEFFPLQTAGYRYRPREFFPLYTAGYRHWPSRIFDFAYDTSAYYCCRRILSLRREEFLFLLTTRVHILLQKNPFLA
ncbi:hypothetical protein AVEN_134637-1 [Araneus ventricosus]|uniref:Uncharacterized protein n=1 Tax=Araneus ventricosus TaxID=182803 RepID=A0A4Y2XCV3_ARAVE|nr:hypothetical protein AVEN_69269-1 [Araneus ventricosus]GBO46836.1 hypothetical protein AVEN_137838-1 [Araneus ventricosus]GBO46839.1 hypothetical protein AVEN_129977-1 [Araneus ventricosus]GBO46841.1 hypothetical protein AVEN_134637-1 [Araneus ventricosus]